MAIGFVGNAEAVTKATKSMTVSGTILAACEFTADAANLDFGNFVALEASATPVLTCTGYSGNFSYYITGNRLMITEVDSLGYTLRTATGGGGSLITADMTDALTMAMAATNNIPVYANVASIEGKKGGLYSETVTLTIDF